MIKKAILAIIIIFLECNIIFAQNSFEIGSVYSLTAEKLVNNQADDIFSCQLFHSYGINGKKIFKSNVFVHTGLYLRNFGANDLVVAPIAIVDDTPTEIRGSSIDIPINIGYYFFNNNRVRFGASLGMNNGFLRSQYLDYYGYRTESISWYKNYIFQFNSSVEIGLKLTNHLILDVKPVFQRQINSNHVDYQQRGIGCQLGISYGF